MKLTTIPHPIPYQGSKRSLAAAILPYFPRDFSRLVEPFAGSAAMTLAVAASGIGQRYYLNDVNESLMHLWSAIVGTPESVATEYRDLWLRQQEDPTGFYDSVRAEFNLSKRPVLLLYLLARCVKGSVRYNVRGDFNQSPDNRRLGMKPETMRRHIFGASSLLNGKTLFSATDYREILDQIATDDFVYMDPPYQGVCANRDTRYLGNVDLDEFVEALELLNRRGIRYIVSYDGRTGQRTFGRELPHELNLTRIELNSGRSSQATLLGREEITVESLYLSPRLTETLPSPTAGTFRYRQDTVKSSQSRVIAQ